MSNLLGGTVVLESEKGKGSAFHVIIPAKFQSHRPKMPFHHVSSKTPSIAKSDGTDKDDRNAISIGDKVMLIIEDDISFSKILSNLARNQGFKVILAGD